MNGGEHWLVRRETIRLLWAIFVFVLAATVLIELVVDMHPHFALEAVFGFNAAYGLLTCVAMILLSKVLGVLIKRRDTYYEPRGDAGGERR